MTVSAQYFRFGRINVLIDRIFKPTHIMTTRTFFSTTVPNRGVDNDAGLSVRKEIHPASIEGQNTVLVTGGSGFLGQHIIKHLQEKAPDVNEIRVLDIKPYRKRIKYAENKPIKFELGSVADKESVMSACDGVDTVYHVAGLVSYGTFPDFEGMRRVNEQGTSNVIEGCLAHGVSRMIFCSTVDVVIGFSDIINGDEDSTDTPYKFLMPGYPATKHNAELEVLKSNGKQAKNGSNLHTMALRCNVLYGEEDPYYITSGLKSAYNNDKVLVRIGSGAKLFQQSYVGNTAWAFLCADAALRCDVSLGGRAYYVPDDTPVQNTFEFMDNFLQPRRYRLSSYYIPSCLVYYPLCLVECLLMLLAPLWKENLVITSGNVKYINMSYYFSGAKARTELGYRPLYSPSEAIERSNNYYKYITF